MMKKIVCKKKTENGNTITVRYPERNDAKIMCAYANTLSKERTFVLFQGEKITLKYEQVYLAKVLLDIRNHMRVNLLIFWNKKLVGITEIGLNRGPKNHVGELGISIARDFRGRGLGKLVMTLILKEAKKHLPILTMVILNVFASNKLAINLYKKFGFKKYGALPHGLKRMGKFDDEIYMYKRI